MKLEMEDGVHLHYTIDDYTDPWTSPQTVVLQHGLAKSHKFWFRWIPLLARDYRVVRFDNRGMGLSDVPGSGSSFLLADFVSDLRQVFDNLNIEKAHLIGESVGGSVAYQFAHDYPERLLSLTTCSSPYEFTGPYYIDSAEVADKEGVSAWVERTTSMRLDLNVVSPEHASWYGAEMSKTKPWVVSSVLRGASGADLSPVIAKIQTPTLVLSSEGLENQPLGDYERAAELIPNARLIRFPGVKGFIQHVLPEKCAEAWLTFAREIETEEA